MDRGAKPDAKRFAGRYRVEPGNRRNWLQSNQRRKFGKREKAMSSSEGPERRPIIISARQGVTGHNVRFVLGFGLAAIGIVFAIIWMVYFA
jgi:hypothetical protein